MDEIPQAVLSSIYGTAANPALWQTTCDVIHEHLGAPVKIIGHQTPSSSVVGCIASGWDPDRLRQYQQHFARMNPWMSMNLAMSEGKVGVSDEAMDREALFKTEFYNDWLRPQDDIVAGSAAKCFSSDTGFALMITACRRTDADTALREQRSFLKSITPHLSHAITISAALRRVGGPEVTLVNASLYGVLYVHRSLKVEAANENAERFMDNATGLRLNRREQLVARDADHQRFLDASTQAMIHQRFDALPSPLAFTTEAFGTCLLHPHILPQDVELGFPQTLWLDPVVGCFVIAGELGLRHGENIAQVARARGATKAEARLAEALVAGQSLNDYADERGISRNTARNQLQFLFQKTGTRSQTGLIQALLTLSSPFRGKEG